MGVPRWTGRTVVLYLLATVFLVVCSVSRVRCLPCENRCSSELAKIVCFITASNEHYNYESLRTGLCSHVVLIDLMGVGKDGSLDLLQTSSRALNRFCTMKQHFRDVGDEAKFIISIGGVAQKSSQFSKALKTVESRWALSDELTSFVLKHDLDGIDIAWFYPAQFGGAESDRTNLVVFLRDLHLRTKACGITLSLTAGVDPKDIELSYDVPGLNEAVDFVNLLTGDYHNPTSATHISPLYGQGPRDRLNINYSVMSYIEAGLNPRKIVILSSCYAYLYVSKINKEDEVCPIKLRTVMRLSFLSAREIVFRESFHTSWDDMRHVPYGIVSKGVTKKWITYNDVESTRKKAEYVLHYQLGGMGLFSVDEDDYEGRAGCGRYPILRAMVSVIYPELGCEEDESDEIENIVCPYDGYLADPVEPECYYVCQQGLNVQECPKQHCPAGQTFSEAQNRCYQPLAMPSNPVTYNSNPNSQYHTLGPPPAVYNSPDPRGQPYIYANSGGVGVNALQQNAYIQPNVVNSLVNTAQQSVQYSKDVAVAVNDPSTKSSNSQYMVNVNKPYMALASTISPVYASMDHEPMHEASNIVPQVLMTYNSTQIAMPQVMNVEIKSPGIRIPMLLDFTSENPTTRSTERPLFVETSSTTLGLPDLVTEPLVLITPKVNYTRTSKRTGSTNVRRRKGRSRPTSARTTPMEAVTQAMSSESSASTTVVPVTSTSTPASSSTTEAITSTRAPTTSASTTAPPETNTTVTSTTSTVPARTTSTASTAPTPAAVKANTTHKVEVSSSPTVETSRTTTTTTTRSTVTTTLSTTPSPNVTFSDETSTISTTQVPASTIASTTVNSTVDDAPPSLLVTTVT